MSVNATTIQKIIDAVNNHVVVINRLTERMNINTILILGLYIILGIVIGIKIAVYIKKNVKIVRVKKVG